MKTSTKRRLGALGVVAALTACQPAPSACSNWLAGGGHPPPPKPPPQQTTTTLAKVINCGVLTENPDVGAEAPFPAPGTVIDMRGYTDFGWIQQCRGRYYGVKINHQGNPTFGVPATFHIAAVPVFGKIVGYWTARPETLRKMSDDLSYFLSTVIVTVVSDV